MQQKVRVAAAQFHVGDNVGENLQTCLRIIKSAASIRPQLLVLPEFSNHCSWYNDQEHCYQVSVDLDGEFLQAVSSAVAELGAYVVINCTVRRAAGKVTGTSLLYSPQGELLCESNKQVLIGHENDFLEPADQPCPIVETDIGRLGLYSCMDGVINETPRCLALRGAQLLCNSLNSFALDEGSLHIPVRAAENRVWVIAANKVGPLIPAHLVEPVSEQTGIPVKFLNGAGDSQIVTPDGTVLAMAGRDEELIYADIDPSEADSKLRCDGTDIIANRRPELYSALGENPEGQPLPDFDGPEHVRAAAIQSSIRGPRAIGELTKSLQQAIADGARLIALPELVHLDNPCADINADIAASDIFIAELVALCPAETYIAASVITATEQGPALETRLIGNQGIVLRQQQLHSSARYPQLVSGDAVSLFEGPYGRIGLVSEDDSIYPETFRLLAMQGAATVLGSLALQERWESTTGLIERSAENRVNIVAASNPCDAGSSLICSLQREFTLMTFWQEREFDGLLSAPEVVYTGSDDTVLLAEIHPKAAGNKVCSANTHLINNRPWRLLAPIVGQK